MPRRPLADMPDESRLWIFGLDRELETDDAARVRAEVDTFLEGWEAHGHPLTCAGEWRYDRFLLIAVDEASVPPSGCSIDAMVRILKAAGSRMGFNMVDNSPVWYRDGEGHIRRVTRPAFAAAVEAAEVGVGSTVFDNTVTRLGQVRDGEWETEAANTWHAKAFGRAFAARAEGPASH